MCGEHEVGILKTFPSWGSSPHVRGAPLVGLPVAPGGGIIPACAGSTPSGGSCSRLSRDHPRMCGEHAAALASPSMIPGSSPHVRGALPILRNKIGLQGIIPACAGSTELQQRFCDARRDHPRMCGEHSDETSLRFCVMGSSPHVRGAPGCRWQRAARSWDHPRMCGEHGQTFARQSMRRGSSPHVRGARNRLGIRWRSRGIIPACAGSTAYLPSPRTLSRDHPRMCGEHTPIQLWYWATAGSSPHVRGAPHRARRSSRLRGIIPACAGSTAYRRPLARGMWDHPRMCGEHANQSINAAQTVGSSPHVRGAHAQGRPLAGGAGIIPACAGSTWSSRHPLGTPRDHPRMCGEHFVQCELVPVYRGSSPHVRGARVERGRDVLGVGIIPACAGSTLMKSSPLIAYVGSSPHVRGALPSPRAEVRDYGIIPACAGSTRLLSHLQRSRWDHPRMCGEHGVGRAHFPFRPGSSPHVRGALSRKSPAPMVPGIIPACAGSTKPSVSPR